MNSARVEKSPVVSNDEVTEKIYWLKLRSAYLASRTSPGQFINICGGQHLNPLWRRPFSVARISGDMIEIIYKVIGRGTRYMSTLQPGDQADVLGPLGKGFDLELKEKQTPLLIGGGLGFAPLVILRDHFVQQGIEPVLFMGAPTASEHYYTEEDAAELHLSSDDGSLGYHGFVTQHVLDYFEKQEGPSRFRAYSCGPEPMMAAVAQICRERDIPLQLSIEREMACGIGFCQGCAIEQVPPHDKYALVCKDGPIFDAEKLKFTQSNYG